MSFKLVIIYAGGMIQRYPWLECLASLGFKKVAGGRSRVGMWDYTTLYTGKFLLWPGPDIHLDINLLNSRCSMLMIVVRGRHRKQGTQLRHSFYPGGWGRRPRYLQCNVWGTPYCSVFPTTCAYRGIHSSISSINFYDLNPADHFRLCVLLS